jgi:hypothetical protein
MINKLFILAIGMVPSIITNNKVILKINKNKYPKLYEILDSIGLNIEHYKLMNYELDAIEYLINKLNIPGKINQNLFYSLDSDVDMDIIIAIIPNYLYFNFFKGIYFEKFTMENLKNIPKLTELKAFIKKLDLRDEIKIKLSDAEYNYDEDFLKSVLDETHLKQYKELFKKADEERTELMNSMKIKDEEINDFIIELEKFLAIKISHDESLRKTIKIYLRVQKGYNLENNYFSKTNDNVFNIFNRLGTRVHNSSDNYQEIVEKSLTIMIINEIIQCKFKIKIYPLINQLRYFNLMDNKEMEEMEENKEFYENKLKENKINSKDIIKFLWDKNWNGSIEEDKTIIENLIAYKKKRNHEKQEYKLKKKNK